MHPGADDNASGTAGVIELARWFSRQPKHQRGILFLTFAGEELGLLEAPVTASSATSHYRCRSGLDVASDQRMDVIDRIHDHQDLRGRRWHQNPFCRLS